MTSLSMLLCAVGGEKDAIEFVSKEKQQESRKK